MMAELVEKLQALVEAHVALSPTERRDVLHFVEHDEYGLALQTWADIVRERQRALPADLRMEATALAEAMGIEPARLFDGSNTKL